MADLGSSPGKRYFETELIRENWPSFGVEMPSYRRSLTSMVDSALAAGFATDRVLEPRPVPALRELDPKKFERLEQEPAFLFLALTKRSKSV